jgi:hypothetical protein
VCEQALYATNSHLASGLFSNNRYLPHNPCGRHAAPSAVLYIATLIAGPLSDEPRCGLEAPQRHHWSSGATERGHRHRAMSDWGVITRDVMERGVQFSMKLRLHSPLLPCHRTREAHLAELYSDDDVMAVSTQQAQGR